MSAPQASAQKIHFAPTKSAQSKKASVHTGLDDLAIKLRRHTTCETWFDVGSRGRYATDASIYQIMPLGVVVPRTEEDARRVIEVCAEANVPVLPRGGGTSQCGQTVGEALVMDCSKYLNKLVGFDKNASTCVVQPGMVLDHLNAQLKAAGLWFPVDVSTAAQATIGGMAGNNSCGSRSIAYGNMVHNVLGIDAILADGGEEFLGDFGARATRAITNTRMREVVPKLFEIGLREHDEIARVWPKVMRRVAGYNLDIFNPQSEWPYAGNNAHNPDEGNSVNLAHLLVGSEGTLAFSKRLHLKLAPLPKAKMLGVVNFQSFYKAMALTQHIVKLKPVAVELVDRTMIDLARGNPAFRPVIDAALIGEPEAILLVEFAGESRDAQARSLRDLVTLMGDLGLPGSVVEMQDEKAQKALWEVRKAGLNIMMSMRGDGKPVSFIEDCAVPLEHLAEYTDQLTQVFAKHNTKGTWYAHASVGTLHVRPILDMRRDGAVKMRAIAQEAGALVRRYKGAFSGEHGDGIVRGEWVEWQYGARINAAFKEIKNLFDPKGILNPGKIVDTPKMDETALFRFTPATQHTPAYAALPLTPALDWQHMNVVRDPVTGLESAPGTGDDATGGFAKAVEMCNNNGHCRKFDAGTMCPSYRVTKNERDLTRGRANTLRLALSGQLDAQLGADFLTSDAMKATMDLCVGCKGCKRECPTGVDMAKMKVEWLHHYKAKHGHTIADKLVAYLPHYASKARWVAPLLNVRNRIPLVAWLGEKFTGFSAKRSLPAWRTATFLSALPEDADKTAVSNNMPSNPALHAGFEVVLFADTFNNTFESENLQAAHHVLRAGGYHVHIAHAAGEGQNARPLCCGRTFLATGMVDAAKTEARRTLAALMPFVVRGVPVVGLEPSCLLTLRDEFLVMGLGDDAVKLANQAFLFEEFLAKEAEAGRFKPTFKALPQARALLHGHCHQKAFDALRPVEQVLRLIPGLTVETIESSCCGMAGAFGYEAAHYDISMQMGNLSLLPKVKAAPADTLIIADGTSCRHQIADGANRQAEHVACVLARALA